MPVTIINVKFDLRVTGFFLLFHEFILIRPPEVLIVCFIYFANQCCL